MEQEQKKRRGRPRTSDLPKEESPINSPATELEIDKADFNFYEPENFDAPSVEQFNPLADAPIKRDYSTPKIQEGLVGDIVEPTFHQPSFTSTPPPTPPSSGSGAPSGSASPTPTPNSSAFNNPNPAMNQLDDAEKKLACEQMVDAALDLYETAWALGGRVAQVSENKLQSLVNEGTLNPERRIPVEDTSVSIFEFFQSYNEQVVEASKVDTQFKKKVRQPMIRVFSKRGWGMTDEQFLGIAFAKDSIMRGVSLFQMKKSINALIAQLAEENQPAESTKKQANNPPRPTQPPPPPPTYTPPPPTQPSPEIIVPEVDEFFDEDDLADETPPVEPPIIQRTESVEKLKINFDDNPLRADTRREPPAAKVEETFIEGGEIKDDLSF